MRSGIPIDEYALHEEVHANISYATEPGRVNEYEAREAARFALLTWREFSEMPEIERAHAVAHYRAHSLVQAHVQDAVSHKPRSRKR